MMSDESDYNEVLGADSSCLVLSDGDIAVKPRGESIKHGRVGQLVGPQNVSGNLNGSFATQRIDGLLGNGGEDVDRSSHINSGVHFNVLRELINQNELMRIVVHELEEE